MSPNGASPFLLEIGCEELPADVLPDALDWGDREGGLACTARAALNAAGVSWGELSAYATARRLVLLVRGVEPAVHKEEKGPPVQVAFDVQGKPTRAAESFASRHGLKVSQLLQRETPKGKILVAEYSIPVAQVLSGLVPQIIGSIRFPKTMRWDETGVRFARPVRWLLALYGSTPIRCSYGAVRSAAATCPTRRRADSRPVPVSSVAAYFSALKRLGVQLENGAGFRRTGQRLQPARSKSKALLSRLEAAARKCRGQLPEQTSEEFEWLLNTVTFLAEEPNVQTGSFRPEYLDLPAEVLATAMAKHLKLFSVTAADGDRLLPIFLAVLEGKPGRPAQVLADLERILEARFTDARLFYREDTRTSLEGKAPALEGIVFHEKLGTVADRIPRIMRLVESVGAQLRLPAELLQKAARAAQLAKADLVTQMVREFPSLQGVVGGHYARHDREDEEIARAITEHYRPRTAADPTPSTRLGCLLGLCDRFDLLLGYFGQGIQPTGSVDPYGLRRQALGWVRILLEPPRGASFVGLSIDRLFDEGLQSWGPRISHPEAVRAKMRQFLRERFEWLASAKTQGDPKLTAAVLAADQDDLAGAWERLQVLRRLWADSRNGGRVVLEKAAKVAERTGRMVRSVKAGEPPAEVNVQALKEPAERELWNLWSTQVAPRLEEQLRQRRFEQATRTYSALYSPVHQFFEKVFVMDEDPEVRRNRLALVRQIYQGISAGFADLSLLPLPKEVAG